MLILKDGTLIYDEWTLRDVLEPIGFDCWNLQKGDLFQILCSGGTLGHDLVSDLTEKESELDEAQQEITDLECALEDTQECVESLEEEITEQKEIVARRNSQVRFLVEKLRQAGIDPYTRADENGIDPLMEEVMQQEKEANTVRYRVIGGTDIDY